MPRKDAIHVRCKRALLQNGREITDTSYSSFWRDRNMDTVIGDRVYIEYDGMENGIIDDPIERGIPVERIVLAEPPSS